MDSQVFPDDVVALKSDPTRQAVVERTHEAVETHKPDPSQDDDEAEIACDEDICDPDYARFLKFGVPPKGTALLRFQIDGHLQLIRSSKFVLVDRSILVGDVVKRKVTDIMSGVILNTHTRCTLQPMCDVTYMNARTFKGLLPPGRWDPGANSLCLLPGGKPEPLVDVPATELCYSESPTEDDLVIYKDWVGRVGDIDFLVHIKLMDDRVVEISSEECEYPDESVGGFYLGDVIRAKKGDLRRGRWIFGSYNPNTPPVGTIVAMRLVSADVTWLHKRINSLEDEEPPNVLEREELESASFKVYDRTLRSQRSDDPRGLRAVTNSCSDIDVRLNLRVRFRDLTGARLKYATPSNPHKVPKLDRQDHLGYDINVFDVVSFRTDATVQWQDLSITTEQSIDLVPDSIIDDEHATWPGEVVHTLDLNPVSGLQHIVQPSRLGIVQSVNATDRMARVRWSEDSHIHYSNDTDKDDVYKSVVSFRIAAPTSPEDDISLYDIEAPAEMNVRRGDIVLIANPFYNPPSRPDDCTWLGEIVDTPPDGSFVVRLGAATEVRDVVLPREECTVAVRSDGTDELDYEVDDETNEMLIDMVDGEGGIEKWFGVNGPSYHMYRDENGQAMDVDDVEDEEWESDEELEDDPMFDAVEKQTPPTSQPTSPSDGEAALPQDGRLADVSHLTMSAPSPAPPYLMLDGPIPRSHHFRNAAVPATPAHGRRCQKEHRMLQNPSALPQGVYVRSWDSRLDLLRALIIGPTETPYENAPFVVDFYLPPSYPTEPPRAYFHSWPSHPQLGSIGRVNPNLYEDGKICLSLLGTWEGEAGESWSATKSTILQVIVSILGLVLVREPYFNEAGFDAKVGTESSRIPSAMYSERVFIRSKGFIITALSSDAPGLEGLGDVGRWLYYDSDGPQLLRASIEHVKRVLEKSEAGEPSNGLTVMSKGAAIPLKRVLERLEQLRTSNVVQQVLTR